MKDEIDHMQKHDGIETWIEQYQIQIFVVS